MLALKVDLVDGHYTGAQPDGVTPEWPPHPWRLFAALAAARFLYYTSEEEAQEEQGALEWLETQDAPELAVWPTRITADAMPQAVKVFVPGADIKNKKDQASGKNVTVRDKTARRFPRFSPQRPEFYFLWRHASTDEMKPHRAALERLAERVTHLGHASAFVRVTLCEEPPEPTLVPMKATDTGPIAARLRIPVPGEMERFRERHAMGQYPTASTTQRYQAARQAVQPAVQPQGATAVGEMSGEDVIVFAFDQADAAEMRIERAYNIGKRVVSSLLGLRKDLGLPGPVPEVLSGHQADGARSRKPHLGVLPLGHVFGDGHLLGFALVLPRQVDPEAREEILRLALRLPYISVQGRHYPVERVADPQSATLKSLHTAPYLQAARHWWSVTPVVLPVYAKTREEIHRAIRQACEHSGYPQPAHLGLSRVPRFRGSAESGRFSQPSPQRQIYHVALEFAEPIAGPLLLGAGRYMGLGLLRGGDAA